MSVSRNDALAQAAGTFPTRDDGNVLAVSSAPGWRDIFGNPTQKGSGSNDPAWTAFVGGISAYQFSATVMKELWFSFHIQHDYQPGTAIYLHSHWASAGTNTGVVRWGFEYTIAKGHGQGAFPATATVYAEQAGIAVANTHMVTETAAISDAALEPDSLVLVRLFRDAAHVNDTQTQAVFLLQADMHYQVDRMATLNKAPNFYA